VIEVLSDDRCIDCDICVRACPTDVFDAVEGGHPVIARQDDCQTCFLCEAYCPTAAIFVAPTVAPAPAGSPFRDEQHLVASGLLGRYRRELGWTPGAAPTAADDFYDRYRAIEPVQPDRRENREHRGHRGHLENRGRAYR
jgi:NAD-dependent dihydropyrimidine dehydrogenase PreA subunit